MPRRVDGTRRSFNKTYARRVRARRPRPRTMTTPDVARKPRLWAGSHHCPMRFAVAGRLARPGLFGRAVLVAAVQQVTVDTATRTPGREVLHQEGGGALGVWRDRQAPHPVGRPRDLQWLSE